MPSLFQFTHPGGVRPGGCSPLRAPRTFQFTHPGGVRRPLTSPTARRRISFNSRTREGCDNLSVESVRYLIEFQFTHPGGVRLCHILLP